MVTNIGGGKPMKDDLFDPVFRMALLEDCERFSRENDATLEVHQGVPILELNGRRVIVHMTAFVSADLQLFHNSSEVPTWSLIYYFRNVFRYEHLREALLSALGLEPKRGPIGTVHIKLPVPSIRELEHAHFAYLDSKLTVVEEKDDATYLFIDVDDEHPFYTRLIDEEFLFFIPCVVEELKALGALL
jgi:hypothetical protein